jgi:hypothetical protein
MPAKKLVLTENLAYRDIQKVPKRLTKEQRGIALMHISAKIMLNIYDMQDQAGITDLELLMILSEEVSRTTRRLVKGKK